MLIAGKNEILSHPNICCVYEQGQALLNFGQSRMKQVHYVCMEMLDGGSLADRFDQSDCIAVEELASWLDVISAALESAPSCDVADAPAPAMLQFLDNPAPPSRLKRRWLQIRAAAGSVRHAGGL